MKLGSLLSIPATLKIGKLAGCEIDRASDMVGPESGVMTRVKAIKPTFIATDCSANGLSLVACEASSSSSAVPWFQRTLNQIVGCMV